MTKYHGDLADAEMRKAIAEGRGDEQMILRQNFETTIGAHSQVDQLALAARSMGLAATVESAGNWFAKSHLVTVEGSVADVKRWLDWARSVA